MISTGLKGLDRILTGLRAGDNVVWQVDDIEDFHEFVRPYVKTAADSEKKTVYMRFADHAPLVEPGPNVVIHQLDAAGGFEAFTTQVNKIIAAEGVGAYYVFDCLSYLLTVWATDLMIGNFFMVTCPFLYELDTIAYFSLLRNSHSFKTIARIRETTQLLIDVYKYEGSCYVHPLKVWNRYSPTMFLPHLRKGEEFSSVADSIDAARILSHIHKKGAEGATRYLDYWDRLFLAAEEMVNSSAPRAEKKKMIDKLTAIMISRDKRILELAREHFTLEDLLEVKSRLIGTGVIGGKAVGMLLARKMISKEGSLKWDELSEPHDSFYIGSDVFYSYIVQNGWWKLRMEQKTSEGYFEAAAVLGEKMLYGNFPEEIMENFQQMIEYFGQAPIIVRSSSLLEDGFGNAFAGKYESIFCANQGTPEQRYVQFAEAVRRIYASTMNEDALTYRQQRGLDRLDEQMALLVQRVSGSPHEDYFYPDLAGVGVSYNTYVWKKEMDPEAGMLRVVYGLGTRAVNRVEGDYPRIAAIDKPLLRPHADMKDVRKYSQHEVDLIDVKENRFRTVSLPEMIEKGPDPEVLDRIAVRDYEMSREVKERSGRNVDYWILTFDELLSKGLFTETFGKILKTLEAKYNYPIDIEFTVNYTKDGTFRINLLQCRPLQTKGEEKRIEMPGHVEKGKIFLESGGYFFGGNTLQPIKRIIYVDPEDYCALPVRRKYDVARIVGKLNKQVGDKNELPVLLLGPGRWGTTTPSLGVPVTFAEINNIAVLGEISFEGGNLIPELSFGTHFFQDLVEANIFYVAIFPEREDVFFNREWVERFKDKFPELVPEAADYKGIIKVFDIDEAGLKLISDVVSQRLICFTD